MLRILPLAEDLILPQARQEIYFFNRIGQKQPVDLDRRPGAIQEFIPADYLLLHAALQPSTQIGAYY